MHDLAHRNSAPAALGAAVQLILKTIDVVDLPSILNAAGSPTLIRKGGRSALAKEPSAVDLAPAFYPLMEALCSRSPQSGAYDAPTRDDIQLFCSCLINGENLGAAIDKAIHFTRISNDRWGGLSIGFEGDDAVFSMNSRRHSDSAAALILDIFGLSFLHKLFSWLVAETLPLAHIDIARKSLVDERVIGDLFGCPARFDSDRTALVFARSLLAKPVVRTYRELVEMSAALPIALMPLPRALPVSAHIEAIFYRAASNGMDIPNLGQVARLLNKSVSTLRRCLVREHTSFQEVLDRWRMQRAKQLLGGDLPIDDIAALLGFSGRSVFSRAFKAWTGSAPSIYRSALDDVAPVLSRCRRTLR